MVWRSLGRFRPLAGRRPVGRLETDPQAHRRHFVGMLDRGMEVGMHWEQESG